MQKSKRLASLLSGSLTFCKIQLQRSGFAELAFFAVNIDRNRTRADVANFENKLEQKIFIYFCVKNDAKANLITIILFLFWILKIRTAFLVCFLNL